MVCSMVKKAVLGAALSAGALYLVFGTSAPSYVRTAFHRVRHNVEDAVPIQFEIDVARGEIANLEPAIKDNIETLARAEVDVEHLDREIATIQDNLASEKKAMLALRERLASGDFRLAGHGHVNYTAEEVKAELARRLDHYPPRDQDPRGEGGDAQGPAEGGRRRPEAADGDGRAEEDAADQARPASRPGSR